MSWRPQVPKNDLDLLRATGLKLLRCGGDKIG